MIWQVCESITKVMTVSASPAKKIKLVAPPENFSSWSQSPSLRGSVVPAKLPAVRNPRHHFPAQHDIRRLRPQSFNAILVLSGGTNMFVGFLGTGRMN